MSLSPRGIDRVELMLAEHFFQSDRENVWGLLPTPWGIRIFPASRVRRGLRCLLDLWHEETDKDPSMVALIAAMKGQKGTASLTARNLTRLEKVLRMAKLVRATGFVFGKSAKSALPMNAAYLNIGHLTVSLRMCLRWLEKRTDVKAVFMLHDAIPVAHPELVEPSSVRFHKAILENTVRFADSLVVTTHAAQQEIEKHIDKTGDTTLEQTTISLPVSKDFETPPDVWPGLASLSFFLVCGAIERRKNLVLLLRVWDALADELDHDIPHLVVAGAPFFGFAEIRDEFANSPLFGHKIHFAHGLNSRSIAALMHSAKALLMPSHAEGFGLPLKEAISLGCPVIASDIGAHREVLNGHGLLLDQSSVKDWIEAIIEHHLVDKKTTVLPLGAKTLREERLRFAHAFERVLTPNRPTKTQGM